MTAKELCLFIDPSTCVYDSSEHPISFCRDDAGCVLDPTIGNVGVYLLNPNSSSLEDMATAFHEISHITRWKRGISYYQTPNVIEIPDDVLLMMTYEEERATSEEAVETARTMGCYDGEALTCMKAMMDEWLATYKPYYL